jgi:hypothetical protein
VVRKVGRERNLHVRGDLDRYLGLDVLNRSQAVDTVVEG